MSEANVFKSIERGSDWTRYTSIERRAGAKGDELAICHLYYEGKDNAPKESKFFTVPLDANAKAQLLKIIGG